MIDRERLGSLRTHGLFKMNWPAVTGKTAALGRYPDAGQSLLVPAATRDRFSLCSSRQTTLGYRNRWQEDLHMPLSDPFFPISIILFYHSSIIIFSMKRRKADASIFESGCSSKSLSSDESIEK